MPDATKPPVAPTALHVPLTHNQRRDIIHYLNGKGFKDEDIATYIEWPLNVSLNNYINAKGGPAITGLDTSLIQAYSAVVAGGGFGKAPVHTQAPSIPVLSSVVDFLKLLANPNTWLRVAEVLLGMLLVGAGLAKMSQRAAVVVKQIPVAGKVLT